MFTGLSTARKALKAVAALREWCDELHLRMQKVERQAAEIDQLREKFKSLEGKFYASRNRAQNPVDEVGATRESRRAAALAQYGLVPKRETGET